MNPRDQAALYKFADMYGVPRAIAFSLIRQESGGNPNAVSPVGAIGYTQLMPGTARGLGVNPHNPIDNLRGGMKYLGHLIGQFGSVPLALAAYNAGPGAVHKYGGIPPYAETQHYVKSIMSMAGVHGNAPAPSAQRLQASQNGLGTQVPPRPTLPPGPSLGAALNMAAPTQQSSDVLGRLGGLASSVTEGAEAPIPLPPTPTIQQAPMQAASTPTVPGALPVARGTGALPGIKELLMEGTGGPTHSTGPHVHVASMNPQTMLRAIQIAKRMGLTVLSNSYTGDAPTPGVHAQHSYHYVKLGMYNGRELNAAIDVSGNPAAMKRYYAIMAGGKHGK